MSAAALREALARRPAFTEAKSAASAGDQAMLEEIAKHIDNEEESLSSAAKKAQMYTVALRTYLNLHTFAKFKVACRAPSVPR
jgi:hypothetical protein